ncbi:carbohydrate binding family 9 domain-containing protein [Flavobacteriales bacterium]|nr:carbohydrate binding family 9 domain-containing protein [Flavobacteriales bacterium]
MKVLLFFYILFPFLLLSQADKKEVYAKRINEKVIIDGKLNELFWNDILPAKDFQMIQPINGKFERSNQKTEVKFAYDDQSIYIGATLNDYGAGYDNTQIGPGIMRQLGPRDVEGKSVDLFGIFLNPFNDGINEFSFLVSAAGVQIDKRIILTTNGYIEDVNWDAVWESNVTIYENGWFVEMRIPYSAIRFPNKEIQEWGINIYRELRRFREEYSWSFIDLKKRHIGKQSGLLKGIKNISPPIRLSLTPYLSSIFSENLSNFNYSGGVDLKYGFNITLPKEDINLTLDMILLPEFQQTEFDPLILNMSPFETQYDEKRSFFTEGTELFQKGNLFYSRRIGGEPLPTQLNENEIIISEPENTRLFNATKISSRTKDGWGIGLFNGITRNTYAQIQDTLSLIERDELIEPVTNYNMWVIDKSFNQNSFITLLNTNVTRQNNFRNAHVLGLLASVTNKENTHTYDGSIKGSLIKDNKNSTSGFSTFFNMQKINGNLRYGLQNYIESDKYDINDMGFLYQNNEINTELNLSYEVFSEDENLSKRLNIKNGKLSLGLEHQSLYKPLSYNEIIIKIGGQIVNKKHLFMRLLSRYFFEENDYFEARTNNQVFVRPPSAKISYFTSSNFNKPISLNTSISYKYRISEGYNIWDRYNNDLLYMRINPRFRINDHAFLQYILAIEYEKNEFGWIDQLEDEPLFSRRHRKMFTNKLILDYTFSPKIYMKLITRHYWSTISNKSFYKINTKGELSTLNTLNLSDLNINFNTWNLDLSFSWEYNPGSYLSILWQNKLTKQTDSVERVFFNNLNSFFENSTNNIFSIKFTYYLDYIKFKDF